MDIPEKFTIDIPPKPTIKPRLQDERSVLYILKEWKDAVKSPIKLIKSDEDIPEDVRENVLRLRQRFIDLGIDVDSMYEVDFDLGGAALATPMDDGKVQLHFNYSEWKNK